MKLGGLELRIESLEVDSLAEPELPIAADSALDKRIDWRYLDLRRPDRQLIFEVQTARRAGDARVLARGGLRRAALAEADGLGQRVRRRAVPRRLLRDATPTSRSRRSSTSRWRWRPGFGKVFEIGPVFRANPSFTSRHDTEFTSVDMEISWIDSHEDVMAVEERWLAHVLAAVEESHGEQIARRSAPRWSCPPLPFPRITLEEAKELLRDAGHDAAGRRPRPRPAERARAVGADRRARTGTSSCSSPTTRRRCGPSTTCATTTTRL